MKSLAEIALLSYEGSSLESTIKDKRRVLCDVL